MAQIGLVCLGILLLDNKFNKDTSIALTSTSIEFIKAVFPNDKVIVISEKIYFRFGKLKCRVKMTNESGDMLCMGEIAGMII
jgi:3-hydroxyacyl-[acyl-carrier-protein] dehydratase